MTTLSTPIEKQFPRLSGESSRCYTARVEYIIMGPDRSLAKVGKRLGEVNNKARSYNRQMEQWSTQYEWSKYARQWDDLQAERLLAEAGNKYQAALTDYDDRYSRAARKMYEVGEKLLKRLESEIDMIEMTPATITAVSKLMDAAANLEAHILQIDRVLQMAENVANVIVVEQ